MPNPFSKGWNYLKASLDKSVDDNADPKVLVHQAMNGAREQHKAVADQAAAVIGNARQLEIAMGTRTIAVEVMQVADNVRKDDAGAMYKEV